MGTTVLKSSVMGRVLTVLLVASVLAVVPAAPTLAPTPPPTVVVNEVAFGSVQTFNDCPSGTYVSVLEYISPSAQGFGQGTPFDISFDFAQPVFISPDADIALARVGAFIVPFVGLDNGGPLDSPGFPGAIGSNIGVVAGSADLWLSLSGELVGFAVESSISPLVPGVPVRVDAVVNGTGSIPIAATVSPQQLFPSVTVVAVGSCDPGDEPAPLLSFPPSGPGDAIDTSVGVTGSGTGSNVAIECIWALQDMDDTNASYGRSDIDYFDNDGNDDDQPDNQNDYPCDSNGTEALYDIDKINDSGVNVGDPGGHLVPGILGVIEVRANAEDLPAQQAIELWMAVDHLTANTSQIGSVFVDVKHPDDTYKVQVHLSPVGCSDPNVLLGLGYDTTTGTITEGSMFDSAGANGSAQVSLDAINAPEGIHYRCTQDIKELYHGSFELSKHQPCGPYELNGKAVDLVTNELGQITSWLYVECFVELALDFDMGVQFPSSAVGGTAVIHGDLTFGSGGPTVKNTGSGAMNVSVAFTALCGNTSGPLPCDNPAAKKATEFNARFASLTSNFIGDPIVGSSSVAYTSGFTPADGTGICAQGYQGATIDTTFGAVVACPNSPNDWGDFGHGDYKTLCANEIGKLDLSVLIPTGRDLTASMALGGTMTVYAQADRGTDFSDETEFATLGSLRPGWESTCANDNWVERTPNPPASTPSEDQRGTAFGGLPPPPEPRALTVLGPEGGTVEVAAIQAALDMIGDDLGVGITYTAPDDFLGTLQALIDNGTPPDIAIIPNPLFLAEFSQSGDILAVPNAVTAGVAWPEDWQQIARVGGTQYGIPTKADLKSLVWYDPARFATLGYSVPTTLTELYDLTDEMIADGQIPWCVGIESGPATGWVVTDWIEDILLRREGGAVYDDWVSHAIPFNDGRVVDAWQEVLGLWSTAGAVYEVGAAGISSTSFFDSALNLFSGECLMHRQASFISAFAPPGFDAFYFPADPAGAGGMPIVGSGTFAAAFNSSPQVWAVMQFLGSADYANARQAVQGAGFLSAAQGLNLGLWNSVEQGFIGILQAGGPVRFDASDLMPSAVGAGAFWAEATLTVDGKTVPVAAAAVEAAWP